MPVRAKNEIKRKGWQSIHAAEEFDEARAKRWSTRIVVKEVD